MMRHRWTNFAGLICMTLCVPPLAALNPTFKISQYSHTAWKGDSGLQAVRRLAQTPDGYLWLATRGGLVRFDGARFTTYLAGSVPGLESSTTQDLLVDSDGSLWIATLGGGVSHYQQGKFQSYTTREGLPSNEIQSLYRDTRGIIWVGTRDGKIARLNHDRFESVSLGIQARDITAFLEDGDHSFWIATFGNGVFRLRDGVQTSFSVGEGVPDARVSGMCRDRSGKIWTAGYKGVSSWDGKRFVPDLAVNKSLDYAIGCRQDRDGNLWVAASSGLFRAQGDRVEKLDRNSDLSNYFTSDVFEDREGNLWAATRGGLDRLRDGPFRTFTGKEGLVGEPGPIIVGDHGAVWTTSQGQVDRIDGNGLTAWPVTLPSRAQAIAWLALPGSESLIGFNGSVVRWHPNGSTTTIPALAGLNVTCLLKARDGTVWIGTTNRGLLRWDASPGPRNSLAVVVADKPIAALAEDRAGAIWAGSYLGGGLYRITGEKVEHFGPSEGIKSDVYTVFVGEEGDLWIGSLGGLSWFHDGNLRTVDSRQGLPSNQVFAIVDDSYGRLWISTFGGIAFIEKNSLVDWAEGRRDRLNPTVYRPTEDTRPRNAGEKSPNAARSDDGHLWFAFATGVSELIPPDPSVSPENDFPQLIEDVKVDGVSHERPDRLRVPPGARSIEIAYTAIALTNPESVRFRYRLDGVDQAWVNADTRRTAFYNNLKPGAYTFTVSSSSGAGQWRDAPALVLEQLPYFYQTTWFLLLMETVAVSVGVFIYRLRVQQAVDRIQAGLEERMEERARIAQELHDTVVQAIAGSTMLVESAAEKVPDSLPIVKGILLRATDMLDFALTESRAALKGLRDTTRSETDLAKQLAAEAANAADPKVTFEVAILGEVRELRPLIRYEVFRIGSEAIANAFRHSGGTSVGLEVGYVNGLRVVVQDNGKGIPVDILQHGKDNHFGLRGIRERADRIGAKLAVRSRSGQGTEIEITVPEGIAFETPPGAPSLLARCLSRLRRRHVC